MLEKEQPDLVSIGPRWTVNHKQYLLDCMRAGCHGLIEKPLSVDLTEADTIIETVEDKNLRWAIAFNFRASPVIAHTRRMLVEEGLIGDILVGAPLWCSASISVDGRPARPADVREASEPLGPVVGTRLQTTFGFQKGINGYFSSMENRDGNGGRWGMEIYGSKGVVTIRMTTVPEVFWWPEKSWAPKNAGDGWKPLPGMPEVTPGQSRAWQYQPIVDDLIKSIEEKRQPQVSLHDGRMATEMIQAVNESHVQGGNPVPIPLEKRDHPLRRWS
jgi:predicted dehydrogenase